MLLVYEIKIRGEEEEERRQKERETRGGDNGKMEIEREYLFW